MSSPPAWSIGTSKREPTSQLNEIPGPGTYVSEANLRQSSPSWKIGTSTRVIDTTIKTPGPGAYDSPGKMSKTAPMYHFGLKSAKLDKGFTPGPGAYNPIALKGTEKRSPAFTMRIRATFGEQKEGSLAPGPGAYDQNSRLLNQRSVAYKIGSSKRKPLNNDEHTPGPGTYVLSTNVPTSATNGARFGTATRVDIANAKLQPGPGAYNIAHMFEEKTSRGVTIVARRPDTAIQKLSHQPGPGAYDPTLTIKKRSPSFRIGSAVRTNGLRQGAITPGPANYSPSPVDRRGKMRIGTDVRRGLVNNSAITPGPGTYDHSLNSSHGPRASIVPRRDNSLQLDRELSSPGPGAYTPDVEAVRRKNPKFVIGTSQRAGSLQLDDSPGPGTYDLRKDLGGSMWKFGSETRERSQNKSVEPGPGAYNIPAKFADVPRYVLAESPKKISQDSSLRH